MPEASCKHLLGPRGSSLVLPLPFPLPKEKGVFLGAEDKPFPSRGGFCVILSDSVVNGVVSTLATCPIASPLCYPEVIRRQLSYVTGTLG